MALANQNNVAPADLPQYQGNKMKELASLFNCVMIGTIQSFDATKQTASISLNFLRKIKGGAPIGENGSSDRTLVYPPLVNCPVVVLRGGTGALTLPIQKGDTCLVLFCDRDIDTWYSSGQIAAPNSDRMHDLSDGIAIVGLSSALNPLSNYNTNGPELRKGANVVAVEDAILIKANLVTLKTALDSLCNSLLTWVDTHGDTPNGGTIAAITASKLLIDTVLK